MTERVEDAVRLLRHTPRWYRYRFASQGELRDFLAAVREGLGSDAGRLRWRLDGVLIQDTVMILWLTPRAGPEPPASFA